MTAPQRLPRFPWTPIKAGAIASIAELACLLFVHSSHRAAVSVVSGQAAGDAVLGWLVVLAEMASVLVLPPVIIASVLALASRCILHVIANRPFQTRAAGR
jgi:hypothetical protein